MSHRTPGEIGYGLATKTWRTACTDWAIHEPDELQELARAMIASISDNYVGRIGTAAVLELRKLDPNDGIEAVLVEAAEEFEIEEDDTSGIGSEIE